MISLVLTTLLLAAPSTPISAAPSLGLQSPTQTDRSERPDLALTIDGESISVPEFTRWLVRFRGEARAIDFVESWALEREARRLKIVLPQAAVTEAVLAILDRRVQLLFNGDRQQWLKELARENRTARGVLLELEQSMRNELLGAQILKQERRITPELLHRAWIYRYGEAGRTIEARVLEIDLDIPPAPPAATLSVLQEARQAAIDRSQAIALDLREQILKTSDFSGVARQHSAHLSARRGGNLLNGFIPGEWPHDVLEPLSRISAGELSAPIFGKGSWWLIQVDEVRTTPFESVRDELHRSILDEDPTQEEYGLLYARLASEAVWEVKPTMWAQALGEVALDDEVLTIDDTSILREEFADWLRIRNGEVIAPRFVEAWIIEHEARKREISITNRDLLRRIDARTQRLFESSGHGTRESWIASMSGNRTEESMVRDMLVSHVTVFLAEDMLRATRVITEAAIRQRWEEYYGPGGKTLDARIIRLQVAESRPPRGSSDEEYARLRALYEEKVAIADEIFERLDNGEDFGALARRYSDDESRSRGGEFEGGFVTPNWPEQVAEALTKLEVGDYSELLEIGASVCIFELLDYRFTPLDDVHDAIATELEQEAPTIPELAQYRNVLVRDVPFTVEPGLVR